MSSRKEDEEDQKEEEGRDDQQMKGECEEAGEERIRERRFRRVSAGFTKKGLRDLFNAARSRV